MTLTVFARAVPTPDEWTLTTGDSPVFPALKLQSTMWEIRDSGRYVNAAKFRAYDASAPLATREAWETTRKGGLPVISQKLTVSEQEIILEEMQRGADAERLVTNLYNDTERHAEATKGRLELAAADVLLDGKLTVNENNFITEVDFGVPAENLPTAAKVWSDPTSDPICDELAWLQYLEDIGSPFPEFALTSRRVVNTWARNNAYRAAFYNSVNPSTTPTSSLTPSQVNSVRIEYGLPPFRIYKGQVRVDGAWIKPVPDDRYIYVPPQRQKWANVQWGLNADSIVLSSGKNPEIEKEETPGIIITRDVDSDPIRVWTNRHARHARPAGPPRGEGAVMGRRLLAAVHLTHPETFEPVVLLPGDEPEEAVAVLITHPDAWEDGPEQDAEQLSHEPEAPVPPVTGDPTPRPPHHPDLRASGRPDPRRPRLPGRRPLAYHRPQTPTGR